MEYKIYRTIVEVCFYATDMDGCSSYENEVIFDDYYTSKKDAIAAAQRKFAKSPNNKWVISVRAYVYPMIISKRAKHEKRIYNKFWKNPEHY